MARGPTPERRPLFDRRWLAVNRAVTTPVYVGAAAAATGALQIEGPTMTPTLPRRAGARLAALLLIASGLALASPLASPAGVASAASTDVKINEVESNVGSPGDWVELYNSGADAVDISGWKFLDNDNTHTPYAIPAGTLLAAGGFYVVNEAQFVFGLGSADSARLFLPDGTTLIDSYTWTAHATVTYGRCPDGTGAFVQTASTKGVTNNCGAPATTTSTTIAATSTTLASGPGSPTNIKVNEVESSGGTPGDWIELYNTGPGVVDISGWKVLDNDNTHTASVIPSATVLNTGDYYVVEETALGFGLGSADSARLFLPDGTTLIDSYSWTSHAASTYGRCPNGIGSFTATTSTKGAANDCGSPVTTTTLPSDALPWPGDAAVQTADGYVFGGNLSGLSYEGSGSATPGVLWGARNGPGTLFRLVFNGTVWVPDTANGWSNGKALRYPDGTGDPDAEGVTTVGGSSATGLYVSTERNNSANGTSRNSILLFDVSGGAATINATREWNLTADLPATGANLGMEAITWLPDTYLTAHGFLDESTAQPYSPATYPDHGTGLFFVGLEANGTIYAYALNHVTGGFTRVATIASGFPAVMDLHFDRDLGDLWAACDDTCGGRTAVLRINPTTKQFAVSAVFDRPAGMPNINNEGFTIASASECVANRKPVYWADDSETGGHSIRTGNLPCDTVVAPPADVPEFPAAALATATAFVLLGAWSLTRRRRLRVTPRI